MNKARGYSEAEARVLGSGGIGTKSPQRSVLQGTSFDESRGLLFKGLVVLWKLHDSDRAPSAQVVRWLSQICKEHRILLIRWTLSA